MNLPANISRYVYLDLEVSQEKEIHRLGLECGAIALDTNDPESAKATLATLYQQGLPICGHNFRRFDYDHLIRRFPALHPWLVIDTLELSILAFPLERSHKLNKAYKLSEYSSNNPLEDARATSKLLDNILQILVAKPAELLNFYAYLLSCGDDAASQAYCHLFASEGVSITVSVPVIEALPSTAIAGVNDAYLREFIAQAPTKDFNQRLCVAGIIAWNDESNRSGAKPLLNAWLRQLPECPAMLEQLKPVEFPPEFTYQAYFQEFGIEKFCPKPKQEEAIQSILAGQNPLILMPTGGGKSLCYQLPALMLSRRQKGLTVVISPLQALMADQVKGLEDKGLDFATFINGNLRPIERRERLEQVRNGEKDLLYISPEQLRSPSIRTLLEERLPALIVFDEAHCISQWGHDFRPDYRYAPKFIWRLYKNPPDKNPPDESPLDENPLDENPRELPLMAFMTATATVHVRADIKSLFNKHKILIHTEICSGIERNNLRYQIVPTTHLSKDEILVEAVQAAIAQGGAVLVYTATRKNTERLARLLNNEEIEARFYHGKIPREDKEEILQQFKDRELNVIVATCAFGMGIDRPDVRAVIHHTMSGNLEGYVQEAGRAGRDNKPATCTLLFDPQDADTAFFLQGLNQLSEPEIRNLFVALRKLRDDIHSSASEEYFWVTANEIFQTSDLDEEFASEPEQRDTKIKVALHYLELFEMIQREENQSTWLSFELIHPSPEESLRAFDQYAHSNHLPNYRKDEFHRLILAMHTARAYIQNSNERFPLEQLSDDSGISIKELKARIKELQRAEVCTSKISIKLLVTKGVKGAAKSSHENLKKIERKIIDEIIGLLENRQMVQINCRGLATRLDPNKTDKLSAAKILEVLEGWKDLKWIEYRRVNRDVVVIKQFTVNENFDAHSTLIKNIIDILHDKIGATTGARLPIRIDDIHDLLANVNQHTAPLNFELEDLEKALAWMHRHKIIRLADGSNLFYQAMKIKVIRKSRKDTVIREYPKKIKPYYDEQARRTHIMLDYGNQHEQPDFNPQDYIADYFSLPRSDFSTQHPHTDGEAAKRPVTQADYERIINPLNPTQQAIVRSELPAIAVIAGPGSGKTRTIVHRIAYLVKVKRVDPARIIALAYNRNAVRELRLRLQTLVGDLASRLRVYTFHGLALAILGRTVEPIHRGPQATQHNASDPNERFTQLIQDACDFLQQDEEDVTEADDQQARITQLLGYCEYIFVDEYQDVGKDEYRLVNLIAGLQTSEDNARSVQRNICVIGDDDQNIYEWRETSIDYIRSFQSEYGAEQVLLTENYRSTEPIIAASNRLIQNNRDRLKQRGDQQVQIDNARIGQGGLAVQSLRFENDNYQAEYIKRQIGKWIECDGIQPGEIAILARHWQNLEKARALLDRRAHIPTYSLEGEGIKLVRNYATQLLIAALEADRDHILSEEESVENLFIQYFESENRSLSEPTVKTLIRIAKDLDKERGYGSESLSTPIAVSEIITSIYEFNESPINAINPDAVLVTSCHQAKGLEFKYVILIADGFDHRQDKIETERRLFYVAMTRAKEKLILTHYQNSRFVQESGATPYPVGAMVIDPPQCILYKDFTPEDVFLSFNPTVNNQSIISQLKEEDAIDLIATANGSNWTVRKTNQIIGLLSNNAVARLKERGINPGEFTFRPGEVTVRSLYRHLEIDDVSGETLASWYVVIPQIRVCR